ncbi:hypothetical protein BDR04DRAFT_1164326 [Suillus decipiens]|nr:hypothetical protein BDR04DRAFT_1164326 [Suillus decipiens]
MRELAMIDEDASAMRRGCSLDEFILIPTPIPSLTMPSQIKPIMYTGLLASGFLCIPCFTDVCIDLETCQKLMTPIYLTRDICNAIKGTAPGTVFHEGLVLATSTYKEMIVSLDQIRDIVEVVRLSEIFISRLSRRHNNKTQNRLILQRIRLIWTTWKFSPPPQRLIAIIGPAVFLPEKHFPCSGGLRACSPTESFREFGELESDVVYRTRNLELYEQVYGVWP